MKKPPNPCYKCPDRHGGCHAECERYDEWHKIIRRISEARFEAKERQIRTYPSAVRNNANIRNRKET